MNGLGDNLIIGGLIAVIFASYAAFFTWVVASINRLDRKIDTKIDALDIKLSARIDSVDSRLSNEIKELDTRLSSRIDALGTKIDSLTVAVARLVGAVWGRVPVESSQGRA
jgi:hypothetical protein